MDLTDYDVDPNNIMSGLRVAIERERDEIPAHSRDILSVLEGRYAVPRRIEGGTAKRRIGTVRKSRLPAWMKDRTLLPMRPPPMPRRGDADAA